MRNLRLIIRQRGGNRFGCQFRESESGQPVAEYTTGIDINCMMNHPRVFDGSMAVYNPRLASVMSGPVPSHWPSVWQRFPCNISVEHKLFYFSDRLFADVFRFDAGMCNDKFAVMQDLVKRMPFRKGA